MLINIHSRILATSRTSGARANRRNPVVVVLLGVSGSGKTTIGKRLARALKCEFYDGDDYHSSANKEKMNQGIPLTDADRWPWLSVLRQLISEVLAQRKDGVVACSALASSYRARLQQPGVQFVYLKGDYNLFHERLKRRRGHFFDPHLLPSQFSTLEQPKGALSVNAAKTPAAITREIVDRLGLRNALK